MTEQKLLSVLDISKDEQQIKRLYELGYTEYFVKLRCGRDGVTYECKTGSLADLAFRLRDEACKNHHADFHEAIYDIMIKVEGDDKWATAFWGECIAMPIHWIIAALIAKGKEDE